MTIFLAILTLAAGLALLFRDRLATVASEDVARVVYGLMALALVAGGYAATRYRDSSSRWLRDALIWVAILVALALAYSFFGT